MQLPIITGLYAGLLGIFLCVLTAQVGILRGKLGISLYDGGDKQLGSEFPSLRSWHPAPFGPY